jgi:carboxylesterase type B
MHLTAYGGRDDSLFRGAMMQSGNPINYGSFDYEASDFLTAASALGCGDAASKLDCMRGIDFDTLNSFINSTVGLYLSWQPIIDGDFIKGRTSIQLTKGEFVKVPIIDGANSDEGTAFGPKPMNSTQQFYNHLTVIENPVQLTLGQAGQILTAYPANLSSPAYGGLLVPANQPVSYIPPADFGAASRPSDAYYGDLSMIAPRRKTCQTWAENGIPAYCYRFNTVPNGLTAELGATHFQEVAFVFDNTLGVGYGYPDVSDKPFEGMPQSYYELADTMSGAWASFVYDGAPGSWWPQYKGKVGQNWVFDANVTNLGYIEDDDWRKAGIDLINSWNADVYRR